ncbi:hypothetical protein WR25_11563 [Diploscapter pachys]|uniref:Membrane insertase YidC/Oxa/ALB C-terminal domain-containing protein n=1 Tax=Diploscapter pachys TaxID=2018661 RepID=A0A2A2JQ28_9BILA|nr:hypothetical protein WR25_11563 [Diploscapter pachys]
MLHASRQAVAMSSFACRSRFRVPLPICSSSCVSSQITSKRTFVSSHRPSTSCILNQTEMLTAGKVLLSARLAVQRRQISSADIFNTRDAVSDIPAAPTPPLPELTLDELVAQGQSVLNELGLISWWKPSSYFRLALESIHLHTELPWWLTIVTATVILRLSLIIVPIMSQRLVAKQQQFKPELDEVRQRIDEARKEGNNMLVQQVLMEQQDFMKKKDIKLGRQLIVMLANGAVFATQFFAVKRMAEMNYPGFSTGGAFWFTDLTVCDPYYALPIISATTMAIIARIGIEFGQTSDSMSPGMRMGMLYGMPIAILVFSSQFPTALCVYWSASNFISLIYAGVFRVPAIRNALNIPPLVHHPNAKSKGVKASVKEIYSNYKDKKKIPPTITAIRNEDLKKFKAAGKNKPVV